MYHEVSLHLHFVTVTIKIFIQEKWPQHGLMFFCWNNKVINDPNPSKLVCIPVGQNTTVRSFQSSILKLLFFWHNRDDRKKTAKYLGIELPNFAPKTGCKFKDKQLLSHMTNIVLTQVFYGSRHNFLLNNIRTVLLCSRSLAWHLLGDKHWF